MSFVMVIIMMKMLMAVHQMMTSLKKMQIKVHQMKTVLVKKVMVAYPV
jgi:hypothetical protein